MAIHRKIHLFDIDVPGKITFKVSSLAQTLLLALALAHNRA